MASREIICVLEFVEVVVLMPHQRYLELHLALSRSTRSRSCARSAATWTSLRLQA